MNNAKRNLIIITSLGETLPRNIRPQATCISSTCQCSATGEEKWQDLENVRESEKGATSLYLWRKSIVTILYNI